MALRLVSADDIKIDAHNTMVKNVGDWLPIQSRKEGFAHDLQAFYVMVTSPAWNVRKLSGGQNKCGRLWIRRHLLKHALAALLPHEHDAIQGGLHFLLDRGDRLVGPRN